MKNLVATKHDTKYRKNVTPYKIKWKKYPILISKNLHKRGNNNYYTLF